MRMAWAVLALASLLAAAPSHGQERGKTTGPEGSEIGKGGYEPVAGDPGMFSIQLEGGGAFPQEGDSFDPPLFFGATASFWGSEFYRIDLSGAFVPGTDEVDIWEGMVGPLFRLLTYPMGFSLGVQAGVLVPTEGDTRFVLSPRAGLDLLPQSRLQLGIYANYDFTIGDVDRSILRTYLSLGYRF
jgi:hypothetical protein